MDRQHMLPCFSPLNLDSLKWEIEFSSHRLIVSFHRAFRSELGTHAHRWLQLFFSSVNFPSAKSQFAHQVLLRPARLQTDTNLSRDTVSLDFITTYVLRRDE